MVCSTCQPRGPRPATAGNAALITMLGAQIANQSDETETLLNNRARLIDGMLLVDICRTSVHLPCAEHQLDPGADGLTSRSAVDDECDARASS